MNDSSTFFSKEDVPPVEFVPVKSATLPYPEIYRDLISIDVIHDGAHIPKAFLSNDEQGELDDEVILQRFRKERDWGANIVAKRLSEQLGLKGFTTVNIARCLMDFGRFPGSTRSGASHLGRFAINTPFSTFLDFSQKRAVLENHYDRISDFMDGMLRGKLLKIAIHTYDQYNSSGTERPNVSLVTRTQGYQLESKMPFGFFDPLYPDILAEFTVDRVLRDRISLTLEKNNVPVAHNYPYLLPEGSTEVRHQVWRFFDWLEREFQLVHPGTIDDLHYIRVWEMLKDTNLRSAKAGELRSILHMYRRPTPEESPFFDKVSNAYSHISDFVNRDNRETIQKYRTYPLRCMSLGVEVRKDLVWEFDRNGDPVRPKPENGHIIADTIARAVAIYLKEDRKEMGRLPRV